MWSALASWVDTATTDWTLPVQKKTFLRWLNVIFSKHDLPAAEDITTVFSDGTLLCILLEILTGRELSFANQPSLTEKAKIRNVELSLALMKKEGIDISGVVAKDVVAGDTTTTVNLIWKLILNYHCSCFVESGNITPTKHKKQSSDGGKPDIEDKEKAALIEWCRSVASKHPEPVQINDFHAKSWKDGQLLVTIINVLIKDTPIDFQKGQDEHNLQQAFETAEKALGIPQLIDAADFFKSKQIVDEKSIMTYLYYFPKWEQKKHVRKDLAGPNDIEALIKNLYDLKKEFREVTEFMQSGGMPSLPGESGDLSENGVDKKEMGEEADGSPVPKDNNVDSLVSEIKTLRRMSSQLKLRVKEMGKHKKEGGSASSGIFEPGGSKVESLVKRLEAKWEEDAENLQEERKGSGSIRIKKLNDDELSSLKDMVKKRETEVKDKEAKLRREFGKKEKKMRVELAGRQEDVKRLELEVGIKNEEIENLKREVEGRDPQKAEEDRKKFDESKRALRKRKKKYKEQRLQIKEEKANFVEARKKWEEQREKEEESIRDLRGEVETLEERQKEVEAREAALKEGLDGVQRDRERIEEMEKEAAQHIQQSREERDGLTAQQQALEEQQEKVSLTSKELEELREALQAREKGVEVREVKLRQLEENLAEREREARQAAQEKEARDAESILKDEKIRALEQEVTSWKDKVGEKEKEVAEAIEKYQSKLEDAHKENQAIVRLQEEKGQKLQRLKREAEEELEKLKKEVEGKEGKLVVLQKSLQDSQDSRQEEAKELKDRMARMEDDMRRKQVVLSELESKENKSKEKFEKRKEQMRVKTKELEASLKEKEEKVGRMLELILTKEEKTKERDDEVKEYKTKLEEKEKDLHAVKDRLNESEKELHVLKKEFEMTKDARVGETEKDLVILRRDLEERKWETARLDKELKGKEERIEELKKETGEKSKLLEDVQNKLHERERELENLRSRIREMETEREKLKEVGGELETLREQSKGMKKEMKERVQSLEAKLKDAEDRDARMGDKEGELSKSLKAKEEEVAVLKEEFLRKEEGTRKKIDELIKRKTDKMKRARESKRAEEKRVVVLEAQMVDLSRRLKDAEAAGERLREVEWKSKEQAVEVERLKDRIVNTEREVGQRQELLRVKDEELLRLHALVEDLRKVNPEELQGHIKDKERLEEQMKERLREKGDLEVKLKEAAELVGGIEAARDWLDDKAWEMKSVALEHEDEKLRFEVELEEMKKSKERLRMEVAELSRFVQAQRYHKRDHEALEEESQREKGNNSPLQLNPFIQRDIEKKKKVMEQRERVQERLLDKERKRLEDKERQEKEEEELRAKEKEVDETLALRKRQLESRREELAAQKLQRDLDRKKEENGSGSVRRPLFQS